MRSLSKIAVVVIGLSALAATVVADGIALVRIQKMTKQQFLSTAVMGLDIIEAKGEEFKVLAEPDDLQRLERAGIPFVVEEPDIKAFYKSRFREGETMGGFRTYSEIVAYLDTLTSDYPSITTDKFSIGTSIQGRDLWVVKISDNPDLNEDEPEILYISLIHAREPCGAAAVLHLMEHFLSNYGVDPEVTDLVDDRELYFLPVQNPDGYVYNEQTDPNGGGMWRKNRRDNGGGDYGVDLNRNYGYKWGYDNIGSSDDPGATTYRGTGPFSEPETDLVKDFIISRDFVIIHNFHVHGNLEIWPYGYDRFFTYEEDFFENLGDSMTMFNGYDPGIGWTLYPTNGSSDDWAWGDTISKPRNISLTVEIGTSFDGFWPPPSRIPTLVAENVWPNVFLAKIADNPYVIAPPKAPVVISPDSVGNDYTIHWQVVDSINPPVEYRLEEWINRQKVTDSAEADYNLWENVRMDLSAARSHSGGSSWHTQNESRTHHWLISATPYEVQPDDSLKFWTWYAIEDGWDYFYVQVSNDGGFTYANLANDLTTNDDPYGLNLGNGITGFSGGWVYAEFDLSPYVGQQVLFRFAYFTDHYYLEEGVYLDDIENVNVFEGMYLIGLHLTDTFYTFESKPAGEYWYRVKATDAQNQKSRYSNLNLTTVYDDRLVGDANGDGSINVADVTFLVDYLFFEGPPPDPEALGDLDCNGAVNIADLTYLVDYLFHEGPPPDC